MSIDAAVTSIKYLCNLVKFSYLLNKMLTFVQCPTEEAGPPTLLDIIANHLRIPATKSPLPSMQIHVDSPELL